MPVITADKFYNLVTPRIAACQTKGAHRRFRSGVHHADDFDGRIYALDQFCKFSFEKCRCTVACAPRYRFLKRLDNLRMCMTDDHRSPRSNIVNVFISVNIIDLRPLSTRNKGRVSAHIGKGTNGAVHSARHMLFRLGKGGSRLFRISHSRSP